MEVGAAARLQALDRNLAIELRVVGCIDHAHRPATELALELVVAESHGFTLDGEHRRTHAPQLEFDIDAVESGAHESCAQVGRPGRGFRGLRFRLEVVVHLGP